jgi:hypothetical protein
MANGHFLGGVAEGLKTATDMRQADESLGLKRDALSADTALRSRGLDLQASGQTQERDLRTRQLDLVAQAQKNAQNREMLTMADKQVSDTLAVVGETITQSLAAGRDPAVVAKAIQPLVASAKRIAAAGGLSPDAIDIKVNAWMARPSGTETAAAEGQAAAAKTIASTKALTDAGIDTLPQWKTLDEKVKAEGALRDDYLKQSQAFIIQRDAKNRLDNLEKTGAGDMTLVFQFMKMLDPGSTVREGEFATAANSGGVPSAVQALYNKAIGDGSIGTKARQEILTQANRMYQAAATQHDSTTKQFRNIAKKNKLDEDSVIVDLKPSARPDPLGIR